LTGRALIKGWLNGNGFEEKRKAAVESLFNVIENSVDEELKLKAFEALVKADQADLKREEVEIKKQAADDDKRLRLLEILQHLPPGAIGQIESGDEGTADI
tara:strand:+ start:98 stop:400 length:303 start_codon:yes stop_codon:yes gene_type:complete